MFYTQRIFFDIAGSNISKMADTEIREGFLCPMCMKDLGTVTQLTQHFEEAHSNEDKAVLQQLKGILTAQRV